jgi:hypothetical protein
MPPEVSALRFTIGQVFQTLVILVGLALTWAKLAGQVEQVSNEMRLRLGLAEKRLDRLEDKGGLS